jgi:peptidoglycan hydrolase-like protein with peptidoglycan-binding domain
MPAFLLEVGFITDHTDNRLFDQNLGAYARAIAKGTTRFFGLSFDQNARPDNRPPTPAKPSGGSAGPEATAPAEDNSVSDMQQLLEARYGFGLTVTGHFDKFTRRGLVVALQIELNGAYEAQIPVSGDLCPKTLSAVRDIRPGDRGGLCALLQVMLILNGYQPGDVDGEFGPRTGTALRFFQRDRFIAPDGVAGIKSLLALIGGA